MLFVVAIVDRTIFILKYYFSRRCFDVVLCSHLAVLLEMKSDPVFGQFISESFIKDHISLLQKEYERVTALHTGDRIGGVTNLEVFVFDFWTIQLVSLLLLRCWLVDRKSFKL